MSYAALQTAWAASSAAPGALPSGVAGTSLYGLSTVAKIAAANGWTVTGTVPTTTHMSGSDFANCIYYPEFKALTAAQQSNVLALCKLDNMLGGSANTTHLLVGMILDYFPVAGTTIANLTAYANALVLPWWSTAVASGGGGLSGPVSAPDLLNAGGLT